MSNFSPHQFKVYCFHFVVATTNYSYGIRLWLLHLWPFVFHLTKIFIGAFSSHWFSHLPFLTIVQSNISIPASHGYHMYSFKQFFCKHIKWVYDFILECLHHFPNILSNGTCHVNQTCIISCWSLIVQLLILMLLLLLTIFFHHFTNLI